MKDKFIDYASKESNPKWNNIIQRKYRTTV